MGRATRFLGRLLPGLLCAVWSLLMVAPVSGSTAGVPPTGHSAVASLAAHAASGVSSSPAHAGPGAADARPEVSSSAVAELPPVVEHSVRFPAPPVAPPVMRRGPDVPARGAVVREARRERAPPGGSYGSRVPRGPPSTRHS
ncbi:hypothetical protein GCM10022244_30840 [Streptomyces gulbargensis]|uniref:Secreted protein n=1 Tax=Streptomyces gulbargensis TaxID=364901 RepID=A0ABP7MEI2_9ACTN